MEKESLIKMMQNKNYDLVVLTSRLHDEINGQTVAWFMQAGMEPTVVAVGLSLDTYTNQMIKQSGYFALNFIPKDRQDLIEHFGFQTGREVNKFKDVAFQESQTGSPILEEAAAYLDCRLRTITSLDTYETFFGEVIDAAYKSLDWFQTKDFKPKAA